MMKINGEFVAKIEKAKDDGDIALEQIAADAWGTGFGGIVEFPLFVYKNIVREIADNDYYKGEDGSVHIFDEVALNQNTRW